MIYFIKSAVFANLDIFAVSKAMQYTNAKRSLFSSISLLQSNQKQNIHIIN